MELKKRHLFGLLALAVLIGGATGAYIVRYTWQTDMNMILVESYELQLQFSNGTAVSSYDWGEFNPEETGKDFTGLQLNYTGNVDANVTWNKINFPSGWDMNIRYTDVILGDQQWVEGYYVVMTAGEVLTNVVISLSPNAGAVPNQPETFTLNFTTNEYTP